jgi:hypothetical protein
MTKEERIENAIKKADIAFWDVIAQQFPEVKTGDMPPYAAILFEEIQKKVVGYWIDFNTDEPQN